MLALIIGGGTEQGIWTDHLLQIAMLPALFLGLGQLSSSRFAPAAKVLAIGIVTLVLVQFVPVLRDPVMPEILPSAGGLSLFSPAPQRSLEAALFALPLLGFTLFLSRFSDANLERCLRFLFIGLFVNLSVALVQLSYDQNVSVSNLLPFSILAGMFVNDNHFSSLVFAMIPLIAYYLLVRERQIALYLAVAAVIVFIQFAVGSRAGMGISGTLSILSLFWFLSRKLSFATRAGIFLLASTLMIAFVAFYAFDDPLKGDLRKVFFTTTWRAIQDHWLTGSGLGTFTLVYPAYELRQNINELYANHVHNDYLEILLETGIAGIALIAFFFVLVIKNFRRLPLSEAAGLSILALAIHSLVDYPLRTMALGVILAYLSAVVLSAKPYAGDEKHKLGKVEHPGSRIRRTTPKSPAAM